MACILDGGDEAAVDVVYLCLIHCAVEVQHVGGGVGVEAQLRALGAVNALGGESEVERSRAVTAVDVGEKLAIVTVHGVDAVIPDI